MIHPKKVLITSVLLFSAAAAADAAIKGRDDFKQGIPWPTEMGGNEPIVDGIVLDVQTDVPEDCMEPGQIAWVNFTFDFSNYNDTAGLHYTIGLDFGPTCTTSAGTVFNGSGSFLDDWWFSYTDQEVGKEHVIEMFSRVFDKGPDGKILGAAVPAPSPIRVAENCSAPAPTPAPTSNAAITSTATLWTTMVGLSAVWITFW